MAHPRVLIADDHPLILEGLHRILEAEYEVVGSVRDGRALVSSAERLKPDAVVLDISMPLLNGVEAARRIQTSLPHTKLVFISQQLDRQYVRAAFEAGASAYVVKQAAATDLLVALKNAIQGRYYVSEKLRKGLPEALLDRRCNPVRLFTADLTPRQREVLQLVAEGKSTKEIADSLNISPKTVEFHKSCIMDELGMRTVAELTRYAVAHGIVGA